MSKDFKALFARSPRRVLLALVTNAVVGHTAVASEMTKPSSLRPDTAAPVAAKSPAPPSIRVAALGQLVPTGQPLCEAPPPKKSMRCEFSDTTGRPIKVELSAVESKKARIGYIVNVDYADKVERAFGDSRFIEVAFGDDRIVSVVVDTQASSSGGQAATKAAALGAGAGSSLATVSSTVKQTGRDK